MGQAFANVLSNAIKYSPENSKIFLTIANKDDSLEMLIQDEGPGIEKEQKGNPFLMPMKQALQSLQEKKKNMVWDWRLPSI